MRGRRIRGAESLSVWSTRAHSSLARMCNESWLGGAFSVNGALLRGVFGGKGSGVDGWFVMLRPAIRAAGRVVVVVDGGDGTGWVGGGAMASVMAISAMEAAAAASEKGRSSGRGVGRGCWEDGERLRDFSVFLCGTRARRFLNQRTTLWAGIAMRAASSWSSAEVGEGFCSKRVMRVASWSGEAR